MDVTARKTSGDDLTGPAALGRQADELDEVFVHSTSDVSPKATIGAGTRIWHHTQVREGVRIGSECVLGKGVYIDFNVSIGNRVKIQNYASVYHGVSVEDGVFIGPYVCLTNDKRPRAITLSGELKGDADWDVGQTLIRYGASLGAGAIILPGLTIGRFALIAAGALVTKDVPSFGMVVGVPARLVGYVCQCGNPLTRDSSGAWFCQTCLTGYELQEITP
jgi:acetyltransferase-like isoleucine patch superfamily enzyme